MSDTPDKAPLCYHLFYDKTRIGLVTEDIADFPSIHCTIELEALSEDSGIGPLLERYRSVCAKHHQFMLDGRLPEVRAMESEVLEAAEPFNEHPWIIVGTVSGHRTTINRPYFGTKNYLRFSYAKKQTTGP